MSDDIGKLADKRILRMKTTEELRHVPFEMYARVLDRAVKAEAQRDELLEACREAVAGLDAEFGRGATDINFPKLRPAIAKALGTAGERP